MPRRCVTDQQPACLALVLGPVEQDVDRAAQLAVGIAQWMCMLLHMALAAIRSFDHGFGTIDRHAAAQADGHRTRVGWQRQAVSRELVVRAIPPCVTQWWLPSPQFGGSAVVLADAPVGVALVDRDRKYRHHLFGTISQLLRHLAQLALQLAPGKKIEFLLDREGQAALHFG